MSEHRVIAAPMFRPAMCHACHRRTNTMLVGLCDACVRVVVQFVEQGWLSAVEPRLSVVVVEATAESDTGSR